MSHMSEDTTTGGGEPSADARDAAFSPRIEAEVCELLLGDRRHGLGEVTGTEVRRRGSRPTPAG
ncbi:hypothetical protein ACTMSW_08245 [Micromonospora sp. BQ11]|uniref:hypothetical protein n=1 Tax=Micromonospora sp. BQ11 TaxID=3452212 RepID=UPI003F8B749B